MKQKLAIDIVKESPYGENAVIEQQEEIVDSLVNTWNHIVTEFENKTITYAIEIMKLLDGFPEKTISEVIDKVRNHKDLKSDMYSKDRIMQGIRLVRDRPEIVEYMFNPSRIKKAKQQPYLKKDGSVFTEFYFILHKYRIDPGFQLELEERGIKFKWSCRRLQSEIRKLFIEKAEPNTRRRLMKQQLIRDIVLKLKELQPDELEDINNHILRNYKHKLLELLKRKEVENET